MGYLCLSELVGDVDNEAFIQQTILVQNSITSPEYLAVPKKLKCIYFISRLPRTSPGLPVILTYFPDTP